MNRITTGLVIAGLVLMLGVTLSWGAPPNPTGSDQLDNTAGGAEALDNVTDGNDNTGFGTRALTNNTGGALNTAIGALALRNNTAGGANTASGAVALFSNTTGDTNTAIGAGALTSNTTANNNTALGAGALGKNTTGGANTASGASALSSNTTGASNTASGLFALLSNTTGNDNVALGYQALRNSTGNKNIAVGIEAGGALVSGNKNIYLGHAGDTTENKTMRLGSVQNRTFIAGVNTRVVNGVGVVIDANGQLGVPLSSARYKRDIETMGARSEGVLKLRPVTFAYTHDGPGVRQYGLIAEEVATVYPELVTHTATGEVQAVRYQELIPMLVNELQRQQQIIQRLERQQQVTEQLQRELAELRSVVGQMRGGIAQR